MIFLNTCWHLPSLFHASSKRMIAVWLHMQNQTVKWKNYSYNFSTTACGSHCWALSSVLPSCSSWTGWLHLSPLELSESCISTSTTGSQVHYNIKWFKVKSENIQCYKTFSDVRSYLYIVFLQSFEVLFIVNQYCLNFHRCQLGLVGAGFAVRVGVEERASLERRSRPCQKLSAEDSCSERSSGTPSTPCRFR